MQVLEKENEVIYIKKNINISELDKNKILISQNNYLKTGKSYSLNEAYNIWATKLKF